MPPLEEQAQLLASRDPRARTEAFVKLAAAGSTAVDALLDGFRDAPALARELRARLLRDHARAADAVRIAALASDPSPVVRADLVRFAARPDLAFAEAPVRAKLLLRLADDPESGVREAAVKGLQRLAHPSSIEGLAALVREGDAAQRTGALTALAATPRAAPALLELARFVDASAPSLRGQLLLCLGATGDIAVLEELLRFARDPIHGSAARTGFDWLVQRLTSRREEAQLSRCLGAWEAVDPVDAEGRRARYELLVRGDLTKARAAAVRWSDAAAHEFDGARPARAAAASIEALCALAEGDGAAAEQLLEEAFGQLEGERALAREDDAADALLLPLARARTLSALNSLVNPWAGAPEPAARLREAYGLYEAWVRGETFRALSGILARDSSILGQYLDSLRAGEPEPIPLQAAWSFDTALTSDLGVSSVVSVVLPRRGRGAQALEAGRKLLDLLSDVNPREFVTARHRNDWVGAPDPFQRMRLLDVPGVPISPVYVSVKTSFSRFPRDLGQVARSVVGDFAVAAAILDPVVERASLGSQVSDLVTYVETSLERAGVAMDARDGDGADAIVARVLARLDAVKQTNEADFDPDEVKRLGSAGSDALRARARTWLDVERRLRSQALITRAVNENVVRGRPETASAYAKKGMELEPTEFNRVLLACYFAREGNAAEARAILRDTVDSAGTYYNLACTYALLGEIETALHYLERDFEQHRDFGSIERQRAWARRDPDLRALAGEARFRALVGEGPASRPR